MLACAAATSTARSILGLLVYRIRRRLKIRFRSSNQGPGRFTPNAWPLLKALKKSPIVRSFSCSLSRSRESVFESCEIIEMSWAARRVSLLNSSSSSGAKGVE